MDLTAHSMAVALSVGPVTLKLLTMESLWIYRKSAPSRQRVNNCRLGAAPNYVMCKHCKSHTHMVSSSARSSTLRYGRAEAMAFEELMAERGIAGHLGEGSDPKFKER